MTLRRQSSQRLAQVLGRLVVMVPLLSSLPAFSAETASLQNSHLTQIQSNDTSGSTSYILNGKTGVVNIGNGNQAIINWSALGVDSTETLNFESNGSAIFLNKVTGVNSSLIDGQVGASAAGSSVIFINPNGLTLGSGFATTTNINHLLLSTQSTTISGLSDFNTLIDIQNSLQNVTNGNLKVNADSTGLRGFLGNLYLYSAGGLVVEGVQPLSMDALVVQADGNVQLTTAVNQLQGGTLNGQSFTVQNNKNLVLQQLNAGAIVVNAGTHQLTVAGTVQASDSVTLVADNVDVQQIIQAPQIQIEPSTSQRVVAVGVSTASDDLEISSQMLSKLQGDIVLGSKQSGALNVGGQFTTPQNITLYGSELAAGSAVSVSSQGKDVSLKVNGIHQVTANLQSGALSVSRQDGSAIQGDLAINAQGDLVLSQVATTQNLTLSSDGDLTSNGGQISADQLAFHAGGGATLNNLQVNRLGGSDAQGDITLQNQATTLWVNNIYVLGASANRTVSLTNSGTIQLQGAITGVQPNTISAATSLPASAFSSDHLTYLQKVILTAQGSGANLVTDNTESAGFIKTQSAQFTADEGIGLAPNRSPQAQEGIKLDWGGQGLEFHFANDQIGQEERQLIQLVGKGQASFQSQQYIDGTLQWQFPNDSTPAYQAGNPLESYLGRHDLALTQPGEVADFDVTSQSAADRQQQLQQKTPPSTDIQPDQIIHSTAVITQDGSLDSTNETIQNSSSSSVVDSLSPSLPSLVNTPSSTHSTQNAGMLLDSQTGLVSVNDSTHAASQKAIEVTQQTTQTHTTSESSLFSSQTTAAQPSVTGDVTSTEQTSQQQNQQQTITQQTNAQQTTSQQSTAQQNDTTQTTQTTDVIDSLMQNGVTQTSTTQSNATSSSSENQTNLKDTTKETSYSTTTQTASPTASQSQQTSALNQTDQLNQTALQNATQTTAAQPSVTGDVTSTEQTSQQQNQQQTITQQTTSQQSTSQQSTAQQNDTTQTTALSTDEKVGGVASVEAKVLSETHALSSALKALPTKGTATLEVDTPTQTVQKGTVSVNHESTAQKQPPQVKRVAKTVHQEPSEDVTLTTEDSSSIDSSMNLEEGEYSQTLTTAPSDTADVAIGEGREVKHADTLLQVLEQTFGK